ncbi:NAD-dependent epimerase/dehydratase family protein [Chitinophaga sp. LS1]|uniref:NAD-dependent epimerase/dehydratase family protein n=1 Tax=Chitinophaga sp. LS1 TaxID=3051176 RepID=UPI002AABC4E8|nr:NAD-dependent epimerase/dehydratase family protein [Chitinophaga sp. LS1]WPV64460.1 NAD-dependent epimerase/dehydratase family protein [Chitinophaga sp. LS1]
MILLTGASGFLGKIIREELAKSDLVHTLGRDALNDIVCDLSKERFSTQHAYSLVVHCAGKAHSVPKTEEEKAAFFQVNYEGTVRLCQSLSASGKPPARFVFISTVAVYGVEAGAAISETHPLAGTTAYAQSKVQAEAFLAEWCKVNGVTLSIVRLPLIAGPNPPGNLGAMINGIKTGRYLSIKGVNARKSVVMAADVATIIPRMSEVGGIYNLTDSYHPTFPELEALIAAQTGKGLPLAIPLWMARMLGRIGDLAGNKSPINSLKLGKIISTLTFDDSKAQKELGWRPRRVLDEFKI